MPRIGIDFMLRHFPAARDPLNQPAPWYVLIDSSARTKLETWAEQSSQYIQDGVIAASKTQADQLWFLRENLSDVQKKEGASIKHDVSVPLSAIPEFLTRAIDAVKAHIGGIRPVPFGHMGDGNIHFNLSRPLNMKDEDFLAQKNALNKIIYDLVLEFGGSTSAEHGIGVLKRDELMQQKGAVALDMMKKIKAALDPDNILNPGKVFSLK